GQIKEQLHFRPESQRFFLGLQQHPPALTLSVFVTVFTFPKRISTGIVSDTRGYLRAVFQMSDV
ncbi:MAG TPA: hypothetical protein VM912_00515, partial [Terriglobales bacterium]|nr:hypothetical protein [Terriglobales bacterium]